ncbi:hypothetical protein J9253_11665 [Thiothrix litoralis]|jgi:hypothetical protein|uniref:Uncharacterized protein n=1 Tax=Thiothrix litoralis TaxID=2891210 RepID=A0ABX7WNN8_9GAMM|nr:hypothetical protein [Thiothrix litoralis]QTR44697.1 hypothetical protein J9253_11665 [Thiothrix litoralis]
MLALYQLLITHWSPPLTLFVIGVACLSLAGAAFFAGLLWKRLGKNHLPPGLLPLALNLLKRL